MRDATSTRVPPGRVQQLLHAISLPTVNSAPPWRKSHCARARSEPTRRAGRRPDAGTGRLPATPIKRQAVFAGQSKKKWATKGAGHARVDGNHENKGACCVVHVWDRSDSLLIVGRRDPPFVPGGHQLRGSEVPPAWDRVCMPRRAGSVASEFVSQVEFPGGVHVPGCCFPVTGQGESNGGPLRLGWPPPGSPLGPPHGEHRRTGGPDSRRNRVGGGGGGGTSLHHPKEIPHEQRVSWPRGPLQPRAPPGGPARLRIRRERSSMNGLPLQPVPSRASPTRISP